MDNMLAMFTALPPKSQLLSCVFVVGSKLDALAFRRLKPRKNVRSAEVTSAWPFLFDQKPSVKPPPAPTHRLPKLGPRRSVTPTVTDPDVAVVGSHTCGTSPGKTSLIV